MNGVVIVSFASLYPYRHEVLGWLVFVSVSVEFYVAPYAVFNGRVVWPVSTSSCSTLSVVLRLFSAFHVTGIVEVLADAWHSSPATIVLKCLGHDAEALRLVLRLVVSASLTKNRLLVFEWRVPDHIAWCSKARKRLYLWFKDQWSFLFLVVRIYRLWVKNSSRLTPVLRGSRFSRVQYSLPRLQMFWRAVWAVDE